MVNTASLPIATPAALAPISAPHIQNGRLMRIACVRGAWGISIQVQRTTVPGAWAAAGCHSSGWASLQSRSEFLASRTRSSTTTTTVSHMHPG